MVSLTPSAAGEIRRLKTRHGALIFHQSGGCCEGSAPMCLRADAFAPGANDRLMGTIEGVPFYIDDEQYRRWGGERLQFLIDVAPSHSDSFSLEVVDDMRFITKSNTDGTPCAR